jgi:hypothetical protein
MLRPTAKASRISRRAAKSRYACAPRCPEAGISRQPPGRAIPAVDRELVAMPVQLETQILAAWALRELLDNPGRDDWDDLVASYRA